MSSILPYSTAATKMYGVKPLSLIDPNNAQVIGPTVCYRNPSVVNKGLLSGWDADAAHALVAMPKPAEVWDVSWTEADQYFVDHVHKCNTPEEVEELLPAKWVAYKTASGADETLSKVCFMCTAMVDRFIELDQSGECDKSTPSWRLHNTLRTRLAAIMELLEGSVGTTYDMLRLKDPEFVRSCWQRLEEEEKLDVMSRLSSRERMF
eukprot:GILI01029602.1.p1 GENE.GILI01029602.1~~GILI01029602.1.p1  ORF type:complete len:207 (+),score=26.71 GILI01029602.1:48-668(+)